MLNSRDHERDGLAHTDALSIGERIHDTVAGVHTRSCEAHTTHGIHKRFKTAFRASCVIINGRACMGMMKNMSRAGMLIRFDHKLSGGDTIHYL